MTAAKIPDADFIKKFTEIGPTKLAAELETPLSGVLRRRRNLEEKYSQRINAPETPTTKAIASHPHRIPISVPNGVVLVGSDAHYWPGAPSVAHRAFVHFANLMAPKAVIVNGDAFDGASISRHPPIGWAALPTVQQEIEACQERLDEIARTAPRRCKLVWSLGNHDARFETRIATVAPEFAKVHGTSLQDHFPEWEPCWATWINDAVVVKHRFKGGMHAPFNGTLWAGKSIITGHLHSAKVYPLSDYNGTRYGVDTGCLADAYGEQFRDYTEDNARNWRSGFAVLTFKDGELLQPELVLAWDAEHVQFRGEVVRV